MHSSRSIPGALTREALNRGQIDVGLLFSTDPNIQFDRLVVLEDDRALQPAENVTPLVRTEVVDQWGDVVVDQVERGVRESDHGRAAAPQRRGRPG